MSIEKEDTILLELQKSAYRFKQEVLDAKKNLKSLEDSADSQRALLAKSAERCREVLDYLVVHHPEGANDWFAHMGVTREGLLEMESKA